MTIAEFISVLEGRNLRPKREGGSYRAFCPAHHDEGGRPSLTIREGDDGRILLTCWSGCGPEQTVAALGLTMQDLFSNNGHSNHGKRPTPSAERAPRKAYATAEEAGQTIAKRLTGRFTHQWTYDGAKQQEVFRVLRFDDCGPKKEKEYRPIHHNGTGYVEGDPPGDLPLYRLPGLLTDTTSLVFVCEGEKAVEAARSIGLLATTSAHGARSPNKSDWQPLAGRDIVILPDNDPAGRRYAEQVHNILLNLSPSATVRIVMLPGLPEGGDIYDFIEERGAAEPEALRSQVLNVVERTKPQEKSPAEATTMRPDFVWMKDVTAKPVQWLWRNRIPSAMLSLLVGIEGKGKTFAALDMAARITTGRLWPDSETIDDAPVVGNVVFLTSEDHLEYTIKPRLDAMKANSARIAVLKGVRCRDGDEYFDVMQHLPALETLLQEASPVQLLIVDPLTAFLGGTDQHKNGEVRTALSRFSTLAEKYGCAILGISHLSKDTSKQAIHRTLGSVAFSAAARAVWLVNEDKQDADRRLFVPVKMNLAPMARSLAFRIRDMAVEWENGQFDYTADEVLTVDADREEATTLNDACQWLESILADGRIRSLDVFAAGKREGFSEKTLKRAKAKLGVVSQKEGIGNAAIWYWKLP